MVVRRELRPPSQQSGVVDERVSIERAWETYAAEGHSIGPPDATVTIVEFSDFQCSFCRGFAVYYDSLRSLGVDVRVVYRHFPLPGHRFAIDAVRASECAAEQGRFDRMHAALFARQDSIGVASWLSFADAAALPDSAAFESCVASARSIDALVRDTSAARRLQVRGTPTLLIHDIRVNGLPQFDSLQAYVMRAADRRVRNPAGK
jgi:protein-disulfide isomerase